MTAEAIRQRLRTLFYFALWFVLNAFFNVYNKKVLDAVGLPWIMTFVQLSTGFLFCIPVWLCGFRKIPTITKQDLCSWLIPLAFCHLGSSLGGVHAIRSGAVSTFQVLKALEPIVTAALSFLLFRHIFAWQVYATIIITVFGVFYAFSNRFSGSSVGATTNAADAMHPIMLLGTFVSMVSACMRSLYSKEKMKQNTLSPANVFAVMNATSLVMLLPMTLLDLPNLAEAQQKISQSSETEATLLWWAVLSGVFFYTNNEVAFYALNQVHPITHAVGNIVRRVLIILASVVLLGDQMSRQKLIGSTIAIFGVFLYSIAKYYYKPKILKIEDSNSQKRRNASVRNKRVLWLCLCVAIGIFMFRSETVLLEKHETWGKEFLVPDLKSHQYQARDTPASTQQEPHDAKDEEAVVQPLVHFLRINGITLNEIVHVMNRVDELTSTIPKERLATDKVLCAVGISESDFETLTASIWIGKLKGKVGFVSAGHSVLRATANQFSNCDAILSGGGTYQSVASWAFESQVPVINLWNTDHYYPQAALLFFHQAFKTYNEKESVEYTFGTLRDKQIYVKNHRDTNTFNLRQNNWIIYKNLFFSDDRMAAVQEMQHMVRSGLAPSPENADAAVPVIDLNELKDAPILEFSSPALIAALVELLLAKKGELPDSYQYPGVRCESGKVFVSGIRNTHDAGYVFGKNGAILFALENERVNKLKFSLRDTGLAEDHEVAIKAAQSYAQSAFNVTDIYAYVQVMGAVRDPVTPIHSQWLDNVPTIHQEHMLSHAIAAFFDSPFESAIVVANHGGGSEPISCGIYLARRGLQPFLLRTCGAVFDDIGFAYMIDAGRFAEVSKKVEGRFSREWLSLAGVFMGYAGLGHVLPCAKEVFHNLTGTTTFGSSRRALIKEKCSSSWNHSLVEEHMFTFPRHQSIEIQRDIASTYEEIFELSMLHLLDEVKDELGRVDGIVFGGGCGLNVKLVQRAWDVMNKPVWVPSAPGDNGLGAGGVWSICQPPRNSIPLQYHGLPVLDTDRLPSFIQEWGDACEYLGFDEKAAERLATLMAVDHKIVAVVIGRQEFGPRALSHRSLLAYPDSIEIRERMNDLKFRQFYRPTCPTVAEEFVDQLFVRPENVRSPFMSFAPELQGWVGDELPAIKHFDNTARPQTLSASREPFIHSMLMSIPKVRKNGKPVVINTSFNIKGQPIINTAEDSLWMLCDRPQLDYLFLDGYLFTLVGNATHPACNSLTQLTFAANMAG